MIFTLMLTWALASLTQAEEAFGIRIVDAQTGRGVPLVTLRTVHDLEFLTDSAGWVAFREPGLMNQPVYFHIQSHGYSVEADGFGNRGRALHPEPAGRITISIQRHNIAERLCRLTGVGIYRDSVLLGEDPPTEKPLLNARVAGQDSVQNAPYKGKLFWLWGDTDRLAYPLGNFATSGALSVWPTRESCDPDFGIDLHYFEDANGFSKKMCPIEGPGPVWLDGLCNVRGGDGEEKLIARFVRIKTLGEVYERGVVTFEPEKEIFQKARPLTEDQERHPYGHAFTVRVDETPYIYFGNPFPTLRVPATEEAVLDPDAYEIFSYLDEDGTPHLDSDGLPSFGWRQRGSRLDRESLRQRGTSSSQPYPKGSVLLDVDSGQAVTIHSGSIAYNPHLSSWTLIGVEVFGSSTLGEIWYSTADTPTGPWRYARKVVTHDRYSFYNPKQHPYFSFDDGKTLYFEGTYVTTFSGNSVKTPLYDYNQILYRLDVDDPRLILPHPVYTVQDEAKRRLTTRVGATSNESGEHIIGVAFNALPRPHPEASLSISVSGQGTDSVVVFGSSQQRHDSQVPFWLGDDGIPTLEGSGEPAGFVWPGRQGRPPMDLEATPIRPNSGR